jgi:S-adenosylmethionine:tRNA ribosyltransferase-isomerase
MPAAMQKTDFHFELPPELIAQRPAAERSASRLLALDGSARALRDLHFLDFPSLLDARDLLVFNDTRVIPARTYGVKDSGGRVEILLERALSPTIALAQVRASKGLKPGAPIRLSAGCTARMLEREGELYRLEFSSEVIAYFEAHGEMPLPPYIERVAEDADKARYQTVFAKVKGAIAAPTAGLHFDEGMLETLAQRGIRRSFVTLHVGAGTFAPMRTNNLDEHRMHAEYVEVPQSACDAIAQTRAQGGRVIAVGTTVVRSLESAALAKPGDALQPFGGMTQIFIKPGYQFRVVDAMVTNFHLPESTLLMLCSAFVGRDLLLSAYAHAVQARYRFFSYGDAMFLTPAGARHAV